MKPKTRREKNSMALIKDLRYSEQVKIARDYIITTSTIAKQNQVLNDRIIANYRKSLKGANNGK